jgi:hypothetical protein
MYKQVNEHCDKGKNKVYQTGTKESNEAKTRNGNI